MSTATATPPKNGTTAAIAKPAETQITYVPLGEQESITLTLSRVKQFLCLPTKSGQMPTDEQVVKYMMLCKAQGLNPWVNDAYLVGYDGKDGAQFSLITAHQAFLKRAEASPEFDGIESGVVVSHGDQITERQGDLLLNGETLVGAWARVHRRDRKIASYDAINLKTFNTNRSRWLADPAGMIVKCAEASALRKAFPSTLAAMYCKEEMDRAREDRDVMPAADTRSKADRLTERLVPAAIQQRSITHDSADAAFIPQAEEREAEPAASKSQEKRHAAQTEQQPDQSIALGFLSKIEATTTTNGLGFIRVDVDAAAKAKEITPEEQDAILDACDLREADLKK